MEPGRGLGHYSAMSPPVPACPEIAEVVTTDHAVHLIVAVRGDWAAEREATSAELERLIGAATAFAASPAFRERFGSRIAVIRAQSKSEPPSVVSHLMAEQGIELEDQSAPRPEGGERCHFCGREHLTEEQVSLTDEGSACPSCFRAWNVKNQPQLLEKPRRLRIPPRLVWPLVALFSLLFFAGLFYEFRRLNSMNSIIRQHMPTE